MFSINSAPYIVWCFLLQKRKSYTCYGIILCKLIYVKFFFFLKVILWKGFPTSPTLQITSIELALFENTAVRKKKQTGFYPMSFWIFLPCPSLLDLLDSQGSRPASNLVQNCLGGLQTQLFLQGLIHAGFVEALGHLEGFPIILLNRLLQDVPAWKQGKGRSLLKRADHILLYRFGSGTGCRPFRLTNYFYWSTLTRSSADYHTPVIDLFCDHQELTEGAPILWILVLEMNWSQSFFWLPSIFKWLTLIRSSICCFISESDLLCDHRKLIKGALVICDHCELLRGALVLMGILVLTVNCPQSCEALQY